MTKALIIWTISFYFICITLFQAQPVIEDTKQVYVSSPQTLELIHLASVWGIHQQVNSYRTKPLNWEQSLCKYASERLEETQVNWTHDGFLPIIARYNLYATKYESFGENLSMGFFWMKDIAPAWKNSPTHYANIIDSRYVDTCIKCENYYCVQFFAGY